MSGTAYERILDALREHGAAVRDTGASKASAQCPAHEDQTPSLSVTGIEGQTLIYCHAGCQPVDVLAALGLSMRDLYDEPKPRRRKGIEAHAVYRYDNGRQVIRSAGKDFRQDGTDAAPELYRLAKVRQAVAAGRPVYVVEGEKDVHALDTLGAVATCAPMGAGKWGKVDPSPLYGATVRVIADQDEPGRKHAADVLASLAGNCERVELLAPKIGTDAADHTAAGYGLADFLPLDRPAPGAPTGRRVRVTWADTIEPEPVVWAWLFDEQGRIPAGALTLAAGREGTGKSSFGVWLTAKITTGTLPGSFYGTPRRVLYVAIEDSWKHTLVPRLMAAGADLSMVGRVEVTSTGDDELTLSLPEDLAGLERATLEHHAALIVLDPLLSMIGEHIDTHRNREVREALDPLARLADRTGTVLLGIAHFNKSNGTDAASLVSGSGAFKDVPRAVFGFARDDDGRVMTQVKNSLGRDDLASLAYDITSAEVPVRDGLTEVGAFTFTGESERTVRDILREARGDDDERSERDEAADWLSRWLTDQGGEAIASDAIKAGTRDAGIAKRTLQRARSRAKVSAVKEGFGGPWIWRLDPEGVTKGAEDDRNQNQAHMAPSVSSSPGVSQSSEHPEGAAGRPVPATVAPFAPTSERRREWQERGRNGGQPDPPPTPEAGRRGCPKHPSAPLTSDGKCPQCIVEAVAARPELYRCPACDVPTSPQRRGDVLHASYCASCTATDQKRDTA